MLASQNNPQLKIKELKMHFPIRKGIFKRAVGAIRAVDGVSFSVDTGQIVGLVGESGSGKSTIAKSIIRLHEPLSGSIYFEGIDLLKMGKKELKNLCRSIQMVFQDPYASLNPRKTILENIGDPLFYHQLVKNKEQQIARVSEILNEVGLSHSALSKYPHQFSGGQQQRISIGRAVAIRPKLLICDEAVSALDLSVQAQVLNLLYDLKKKFHFSCLFISHDLSVVRNFCDEVVVLYQGKVVEKGKTVQIFEDPQHQYTKALIGSVFAEKIQ